MSLFVPEALKENIKVFEESVNTVDNTTIAIAKNNGDRVILASGSGDLFDELSGDVIEGNFKISPRTHENRLVINEYLPFTKPQAFGKEITTIGLGDRLGLAALGHIEAVTNREVRPILAQQSIRELDLTERTYEDVIDAAAYAVLEKGYKKGYGADGDHLKLEKDIEYAFDVGASMLTLDCSDYIDNGVIEYSDAELSEKFESELVSEYRQELIDHYLNQTFEVGDLEIRFDKKELEYNAVQYHKGIEYMIHIYNKYIKTHSSPIDFEISIDETMTVTSPESHFFVANELIRAGVEFTSLAPRYTGEFQKGIDYIGELEDFEYDFSRHVQISDHFDYKISVHSGSDKFSVFPIIARLTKKPFHIKTAGTNWLEALRVIAVHDHDFFRELYQFADDNFEEAQKYYYITPDLDAIPALDTMADEDLKKYLDDVNARQLLHVTYGLILTHKDGDEYVFKDRLYDILNQYEDEYATMLKEHIGKHLDLLDIKEQA